MAQFRRDQWEYLPNGNTLFEVVMLADQYGNPIGPANPTGMSVDAFGRARISQPFTLFDSFNRYHENQKFVTDTGVNGNTEFDISQSTVMMNVDDTDGSYVTRETNKVFAYQPGKSLQILNTLVMGEAKDNLRQAVGYFDDDNGIFIERIGSDVNIVKRTNISGTPTDIKVAQADWNIDTMLGDGQSLATLDLSKAQIFFIDIEWLGVGSVRCGFVINGKFIHCHSFHHANSLDSVYMQTACLPIRYEIENVGATDSSSTLKQICSTVISEGGYELHGKQHTVSTGILTADLKNLETAGVFYPVISIRLKSDRLNSIVVPRRVNLLGVGNNTRIAYKIVKGGTLTGNTEFVSVSEDSCIEYNIEATGISGGTDLITSLTAITNQVQAVESLGDSIFNYQLERDGLAGTATIFTIVAAGASGGDDVAASIDFEEIT